MEAECTMPTVGVVVPVTTAVKIQDLSESYGVTVGLLVDQALESWLSENHARKRRFVDFQSLQAQDMYRTPQSCSLDIKYFGIPYPSEMSFQNISRAQQSSNKLNKASQQFSCWSELPDNVSRQLVNLLDPRTSANLRLTCRSWAEIVFQHKQHVEMDIPIRVLQTTTLQRLPSLSSLRLKCRAEWVVPELSSISRFLKGSCASTDLDLSVSGWQLAEKDLLALASATNITRLSLRNTGVDGAAVMALACLTGLTSLDVGYCNAGPETLGRVAAAAPQLTALDWSGNSWYEDQQAASRARQQELGALGKSLTWLSLTNCRLRDAGLAALAGLSRLRSLDLSILSVGAHRPPSQNMAFLGDDCLFWLQPLSSLRTLRMQNQIQISCEGLRLLEPLSQMTELDLSGCVSLLDEGTLSGLAGLTSLRRLSLQAVNSGSGDAPSAEVLLPLCSLRFVEELDVSENWDCLSAESLACLADLPSLRVLHLGQGTRQRAAAAALEGLHSGSELLLTARRMLRLLEGTLERALPAAGDAGPTP
mmetsp:Transcript_1281/g.3064  ORF Transcript_1281/g.3064 Transcript_1281/m.3064 type:complete len:535 (+) Transcript_1281:646-2250(+)|eukprot:CAMPEP_0177617018 /NCGR_PEP_ID=MMETSP0419_2-20121207/24584_1 /TAXON_ID=582737 /ORGANISM="Tetraselmis sp., Strain GSL018" /LENGTH=534 /DNA_ID=CAMNT_0019115353 /DNA_START=241 /DNA_END=1845 /DNA_ORIENTATION=+